MSVLFGMWYGSLYAYHGLQRMSVLTFVSFLTAALYDLAVTGPLTFSSAIVANLPSMKPIWENACGAIVGEYFLRTASIKRVSGPTDGSRLENSWLIQRCPSNCGNCPAMNVFAIGVDEPHLILSTMPSEIAALMNAGAVSGVKSRMIPLPSPANWYICSSCDLASVTGRCVGKTLTSTFFALPSLTTPASAYAESVSGDAIAIFLTPARISACAAPMSL